MLIILEGPEATGKSTHARLLASALIERGYEVFLTKEPGSPHDPICGAIRKLLLDPSNIISDKAALFLFLADRAQHMEIVTRELALGKIVISDRSSLSTYVYHTAKERDYVSDRDTTLCAMLDEAQQIQPDMCLIFNASFEWSMTQLRSRGTLDRIEKFDETFHANTHTLFGQEPISTLTSMMHSSRPKEVIHVPETSGHTENDISQFILNSVMQHLEYE